MQDLRFLNEAFLPDGFKSCARCRTKKFAGKNKRRQKYLFLNIEYLYSNITIISAGCHRTKTKEKKISFPRLTIYHFSEKDNW